MLLIYTTFYDGIVLRDEISQIKSKTIKIDRAVLEI